MTYELTFDEKMKDTYWRFIHERHEIFNKRFLEGQPGPWTTDPVLQRHYFTNVYRELDRGTLFLEEGVTQGHLDTEAFVRVLVYRCLNNIEAFRSLIDACEQGGCEGLSGAPLDFITEWAVARDETDEGLFTAAHLPPMVKFDPLVKSKTEAVFTETIGYILKNQDTMYTKVVGAPDLKSVFEEFLEIPGIGPFYAYEFATDMAHLGFVHHSLDSWANIGPGCKRGLAFMVKMGNFYDAMVWLRDHQDEEFKRLGLPFRYYEGKKLSLRNIEHCLCEFSKYIRAQETGWSRRTFQPKGLPLDIPEGVIR